MNKSILFAVSHMNPFTNTPVSALNFNFIKKVSEQCFDVSIIIPANADILREYDENLDIVATFTLTMSDTDIMCTIKHMIYDGIKMYIVDISTYFDRQNLFGYLDDCERYIGFTKAVLEALPVLNFKPDIIHCQDWSTALIPFLLKHKYINNEFYKTIKTFLTFNNLAGKDLYGQGIFDKENVQYIDIAWDEFKKYEIDYYDQINFLKTGLKFADFITTVSPNYANEITIEMYGLTLEDVIKSREKDICGIINGIDIENYNPSTDKSLFANYDTNNLDGKWVNKAKLQEFLGFDVCDDVPLILFNSNFRADKGIELIQYCLDDLLKSNVQLLMIYCEGYNTFEQDEESLYLKIFQKESQKYKANFRLLPFDEELSRKAFAGADIFLMPSASEPCGIEQLIAMRYGTIPVVKKIGGLVDTVIPYNDQTGEGCGFGFKYSNERVLLHAIRKAIDTYKQKSKWNELIKNCMCQNYGIDRCVGQYIELYQKGSGQASITETKTASILFVTSQLYPYATGTMGIFNYSLPKGLRGLGFDARVIAPRVSKPAHEYPEPVEVVATLDIKMAEKTYTCTVESGVYDGVPMYYINQPYYFGRDSLYGYPDEVERFAYFCKAVVESLPFLGYKPQILHCQDWHTGFIPVLLKLKYSDREFYQSMKTLLTVHNLGYQGAFDKENCTFFDLDWDEMVKHQIDYYDQINFMKAGLTFADFITTVSPTYSKEIATEQYGCTLEEVVKTRTNDIFGVLCGLDLNINDPATDTRLYANYDAYNLEGKRINKRKLQEALNLPVRDDVPILSLFSRLKTEKGLDLVRSAMDDLMKSDLQFVMVSNGDEFYEEYFKECAKKYPDKFSFTLYDNDFAYKAYAGTDIFLMPSSYEPCGIGQLIALRYGTVPVVHQVGGLNDSIQSFNQETGEGNGFSFKPYSSKVLLYTIRRAIEIYHNKAVWTKIVQNCMLQNHGWARYVGEYVGVYKNVLLR